MLQPSQAEYKQNGPSKWQNISAEKQATTQHRRTKRRGVQGRSVKVGQRFGRHGVAELAVTGGGLVGHPGGQQPLREHAVTP